MVVDVQVGPEGLMLGILLTWGGGSALVFDQSITSPHHQQHAHVTS